MAISISNATNYFWGLSNTAGGTDHPMAHQVGNAANRVVFGVMWHQLGGGFTWQGGTPRYGSTTATELVTVTNGVPLTSGLEIHIYYVTETNLPAGGTVTNFDWNWGSGAGYIGGCVFTLGGCDINNLFGSNQEITNLTASTNTPQVSIGSGAGSDDLILAFGGLESDGAGQQGIIVTPGSDLTNTITLQETYQTNQFGVLGGISYRAGSNVNFTAQFSLSNAAASGQTNGIYATVVNGVALVDLDMVGMA